MRIHDRYLLKQYLRVFFISVLVFVSIFIVVNVFEEIDNFIDHDASIKDIATYYVFTIPFVLTYVTPVSLLLGTVFCFGVMSRRNELTALIASGVSLMRIAAPILGLALLVSVFSAYFNDVVVANANRIKDEIMLYKIEGAQPQPPGTKRNFYYLGANGYAYLAGSYVHETRTLNDVVIQQFDGSTLRRRIDARRAEWDRNTRAWILSEGVERVFDGDEETVRPFVELAIPEIVETPDDFGKKEITQENMTFVELRDYIAKVRLSGGDARQYVVDLYFKLSFPFAGLIFVVIGVAFASGKRKPSVATGFGLTLVVAFIYYVVLRIGQALGHNGAMPPLLAAQLGNAIFSIVGLFSLARANR